MMINSENELDEVSMRIIEERNREIEEISDELADLSEISETLASMLVEQGETLDKIDKILDDCKQNIEETEIILQNTSFSTFSKVKNTVIIVGGLSAGALGFMVGPIIGLATLLSGASISTGIVLFSKISSSEDKN